MGERANALDEIDDGADGRGQHNQITALNSLDRIFAGAINGAHGASTIQHRLAVGSDDLSGESRSLEGQSQRATDEARADDGDLLEGHVTGVFPLDLKP